MSNEFSRGQNSIPDMIWVQECHTHKHGSCMLVHRRNSCESSEAKLSISSSSWTTVITITFQLAIAKAANHERALVAHSWMFGVIIQLWMASNLTRGSSLADWQMTHLTYPPSRSKAEGLSEKSSFSITHLSCILFYMFCFVVQQNSKRLYFTNESEAGWAGSTSLIPWQKYLLTLINYQIWVPHHSLPISADLCFCSVGSISQAENLSHQRDWWIKLRQKGGKTRERLATGHWRTSHGKEHKQDSCLAEIKIQHG